MSSSLFVLCFVCCDISAQDIDGRTPLFFASANNQFNACALLVDASFDDVLVKDFRGDTPLHAAACNNNVECLEVRTRSRRCSPVVVAAPVLLTPTIVGQPSRCVRDDGAGKAVMIGELFCNMSMFTVGVRGFRASGTPE